MLAAFLLAWLTVSLTVLAPAQAQDRTDAHMHHCDMCAPADGTGCGASGQSLHCGHSASCLLTIPPGFRDWEPHVTRGVPPERAPLFSIHVSKVPSRPPLA